MGLQRMIVEAWGSQEAALAAAEVAKQAGMDAGLSVSRVVVVSHPGQADEETHVLYSVG